VALTLRQNELLHASEDESFFASILEIQVDDGRTQQAVVRDMHRHPYKPIIMHIDFMRVTAEEVLRMSVPLHFVGEAQSPAGKASGVIIQHQLTEVEIAALPKNLPEYLEVDLSNIKAGDVVMLSDIVLPEGVSIPALAGDAHDATVANAVHVRADQGTGVAAAAEATVADELGELPEDEADETGEEEGDAGEEQES
jgi:large subunit ribosomal protein L25